MLLTKTIKWNVLRSSFPLALDPCQRHLTEGLVIELRNSVNLKHFELNKWRIRIELALD